MNQAYCLGIDFKGMEEGVVSDMHEAYLMVIKAGEYRS